MRPRLSDSISMAELHSMRNRMSIKDMAQQLDVSINTLYKYLNGYKAKKASDEETGERIVIKPELTPAPEPDDIVKNARTKFMERMGVEKKPTGIKISFCRYESEHYGFDVSKDGIRVYELVGLESLMIKDVDALIAELQAVREAAKSVIGG